MYLRLRIADIIVLSYVFVMLVYSVTGMSHLFILVTVLFIFFQLKSVHFSVWIWLICIYIITFSFFSILYYETVVYRSLLYGFYSVVFFILLLEAAVSKKVQASRKISRSSLIFALLMLISLWLVKVFQSDGYYFVFNIDPFTRKSLGLPTYIIVILLVFRRLEGEKLGFFVLGIGMLLSVLGVTSGSRTELLLVLVSAVLIVLHIVGRPVMKTVLVVCVVFASVIFSSYFLFLMSRGDNDLVSNFSEVKNGFDAGNKLMIYTFWRGYENYLLIQELLVSNPMVMIFGNGFARPVDLNGSFWLSGKEYSESVWFHNGALYFLFQTGLVGFIFLVVFIKQFFETSVRGLFTNCGAKVFLRLIYFIIVGILIVTQNGFWDYRANCEIIVMWLLLTSEVTEKTSISGKNSLESVENVSPRSAATL